MRRCWPTTQNRRPGNAPGAAFNTRETHMPQLDSHSAAPAPAPRRPWTAPRLDEMPRLTELTLQSPGGGIPGDCTPGNPGSCF